VWHDNQPVARLLLEWGADSSKLRKKKNATQSRHFFAK
jgi:hypothetical protein